MKIKIQPQELGNGTLPYPYWIDDDNAVGRQDFWKGKPYRLIGFCKKLEAGAIDLYIRKWRENPEKAIGMYPIFADKKDNWDTYDQIIASVQVKQ